MAISSINSAAGALTILSGNAPSIASILSGLASQSQSGTQLAQKAALGQTRTDLLKQITALSDIQAQIGSSAAILDADGDAPATAATLQDYIDKAASADGLDAATSGYNRTVATILSGISDLPSLSARDQLDDRAALAAALDAVRSFADSAAPNALAKANSTTLSTAGNADGTDKGRSGARRVANYLGQAVQTAIDQLKTQVESIDYRTAGLDASLTISGTTTADSAKTKALGSLQTQLINLQRTFSYIGRTAGEQQPEVDGFAAYPTSPSTLQDYISYAQLSSSEDSGATGFNALRESVNSAIAGLSAVDSKYLVDESGLNRAIATVTEFSGTEGETLLAAHGTTAATGTDPTYDFTDYGNATGTDGKRSEARSTVNDLKSAADAAAATVARELASVSAQLAAVNAASAAASSANIGSAADDLGQLTTAQTTVSTALSQLSKILALAGSMSSQIAEDQPPAGVEDSLSDALGRASDADTRGQAVADFNRSRDQIVAALKGLPSLQGSVFNDPDALTAAGDALIQFIQGASSGQLLEASATTPVTNADGTQDETVYDFSAAGNASGSNAGRSQARRTLNELIGTVRDAYVAYSQELAQVNLKVGIAQVAQQASVASFNSSLGGGNTLLSIVNDSSASSAQLQSQSARRQTVTALTSVDSVLTLLGGTTGPNGGAASKGAANLMEAIDEAGSSDDLADATARYNALYSDLSSAIGGMAKVNTVGMSDRTGVGSVKTVLAQYLEEDGSGARADRLRKATASTDKPATGSILAGSTLADTIDLGYAGNKLGTDDGRSEARRVATSLVDDAGWSRTLLTLQLLNQDSTSLGTSASAALAAYLKTQSG